MINIPEIPAVSTMTAADEIWLCAGVPWDNSYNHVRLFNTKADAIAYVETKTVYHVIHSTPIRNMRMRVPVSEDYANRYINYLIYANRSLQNTHFMCFVTDIKWLSVNSCEITFEYDIFQTFFYSAKLSKCFTVREHVTDDTPGKNILEEGVPYGDVMIAGDALSPTMDTDPYVAIYVGEVKGTDGEWNPVGGGIMGGVYSGLYPLYYPMRTTEEQNIISAKIKEYVQDGKADAIAIVQMLIHACVTQESVNYNIVRPDNLGGYVPRNKKLLTYPYLRVVETNNLGQAEEFKFELGKNNTLTFEVTGYASTQPVIRSVPLNYGQTSRDDMRAMLFSSFPQCSWTVNAYYSWYAQNRNSLAMTVGRGALDIIGGAAIMAGVPSAETAQQSAQMEYSGLSSLLTLYADVKDKQAIPSTITGHVLNDNICFATNLILPKFYIECLREEWAKSLDDYFDLVGYKVNTLKIPETKNRRSWNYVQTRDCQISGQIPKQYKRVLERLFDRGITIWHTNDIGNYSLNNDVVI